MKFWISPPPRPVIRHLRFSQQCWWRVKSCGLRTRVDSWRVTAFRRNLTPPSSWCVQSTSNWRLYNIQYARRQISRIGQLLDWYKTTYQSVILSPLSGYTLISIPRISYSPTVFQVIITQSTTTFRTLHPPLPPNSTSLFSGILLYKKKGNQDKNPSTFLNNK
jgi:hypothetical protein